MRSETLTRWRNHWITELTGWTLNWLCIIGSLLSFLLSHMEHKCSFSFTLSPPHPASFHFSALSLSLTVRRYLKDQITMATISHIVIAHTCIWWLFLFCRVCRCTHTSLAVCQVTCSDDEGTMLPSVGSKCLHTETDTERTFSIPVMTHDRQSHAN